MLELTEGTNVVTMVEEVEVGVVAVAAVSEDDKNHINWKY